MNNEQIPTAQHEEPKLFSVNIGIEAFPPAGTSFEHTFVDDTDDYILGFCERNVGKIVRIGVRPQGADGENPNMPSKRVRIVSVDTEKKSVVLEVVS